MTQQEIIAAIADVRWKIGAQQSAIANGDRVEYRQGQVAKLTAQLALLEAQLASAAAPNVFTSSDLIAAIADNAADIRLAPGAYGSITLDRKRNIAISAPQGEATFGSITLTGVQGISLSGLTYGALTANIHWQGQKPSGLTVQDCTSQRTYIRNAEDVHIVGGDFTGNTALTFFDVAGGSITGAYIHHATEDCLRLFGNTYGITVEDCRIEDTVRNSDQHPDLFQIAHASTGDCPHDLIIRRNWLTDDPTTGFDVGQGIYLGGPLAPNGFRNILIEENVLAVPHPQGIYVTGGTDNVVIRKNTLIPTSGGTRANIRAAQIPYAIATGMSNAGVLIEQNICLNIMNEGSLPRATVRDNAMLPAGKSWSETFPGPGMALADFIPLVSAGIPDSYGATEWLRSKLAA